MRNAGQARHECHDVTRRTCVPSARHGPHVTRGTCVFKCSPWTSVEASVCPVMSWASLGAPVCWVLAMALSWGASQTLMAQLLHQFSRHREAGRRWTRDVRLAASLALLHPLYSRVCCYFITSTHLSRISLLLYCRLIWISNAGFLTRYHSVFLADSFQEPLSNNSATRRNKSCSHTTTCAQPTQPTLPSALKMESQQPGRSGHTGDPEWTETRLYNQKLSFTYM